MLCEKTGYNLTKIVQFIQYFPIPSILPHGICYECLTTLILVSTDLTLQIYQADKTFFLFFNQNFILA